MSPTTPFSTLARAMTRGVRPADVLQELHQELMAATAADRSLVLEEGPSGSFIPSSGRGFAALEALSVANEEARALSGLIAVGAGVRSLIVLPRLAAELGSTGLVVPIQLARRATVLIAAEPRVPEEEALAAGLRAAVEFGIVLEWSRLSRESTFHHRMRELSLVFSRRVTSIASLAPALEIVAHDANLLLGTRRMTIWLHDRKARELVLTASSDPAVKAAGTRVTVDSAAPAARGLRLERPGASGRGADRTLIAPLKGWRRAQGTLILEGTPTGLADEELTELTQDLARQLAAGIENAQLLDDVMRGRRLLEDSFNSLADLVIVTDAALRVLQANDACLARLDRSRSDVLGRDLADVLGSAVAARAGGDALVTPAVFEGPPLPGIFSVTALPLLTEADEKAGRVVVCRDITEQSRLEREREALGARLAQSEKLAALGQFVAGIAHEMNNPLQGILGHLELLIDHSEKARPIRAELRRIFREAERANRIVRNLLVFTGSRRMTRRRLRLDRLLTRAIASRRVALERAKITVVRDFDEAVPAVTGDPLLLQQAFLNVLINAEHAIDAAGRANGVIRVTTRGAGGRAVAAIADSGTGIPPAVMPRLFDPFFTTKAVGRGTGLGLAITYGIVQEHDGTIEAANADGGGAVFTIALPAGR